MNSVGIGLLGYGFMGKAHSRAFRDVGRFFDLPVKIEMKVIGGRNSTALQDAAIKYGWDSCDTDIEKIIRRPDVDVIDVATPGWAHKEQVIQAAKNGKHIICEKPIANNLKEALQIIKAVRETDVKHFVMFNYRRVPAVALAREMILGGELGEIYHFRGFYLQDWIVDPKFPRVWRLDKAQAGSGALGDIGSHIIDMARYLIGDIEEVIGVTKTFVKRRPLPDNLKKYGKVDVDDAAAFIANFENGIYGTFEATRFASGRKNYNGFEINGSKGSLVYNFEDMNELHFYSNSDKIGRQGFKKILVTDKAHPYIKSWWPPGHIIGYEHTFVNAIYDFIMCIVEDKMPSPDLFDGAKVQAVLEAVEISAKEKSWIKVEEID